MNRELREQNRVRVSSGLSGSPSKDGEFAPSPLPDSPFTNVEVPWAWPGPVRSALRCLFAPERPAVVDIGYAKAATLARAREEYA